MKRPRLIHPFLFALFPILFKFVRNIETVAFSENYLPLGLSIIFTAIIWFFWNLLVKDKVKTSILTTVFLFLFFSYGHFTEYFGQLLNIFFRHRYFLLLWAILYALATYFIIKTRRDLQNLTKILNFVGIFLVALQIINIVLVVGYWQRNLFIQQPEGFRAAQPTVRADFKKYTQRPDIYYIILDAYGRQDILKDIYQYDNSDLIQYLRQKGFYVADKSVANYHETVYSLRAILNLNYIHNTISELASVPELDRLIIEMIRNNQVFEFLKKQGYRIWVFSSELYLMRLNDRAIRNVSFAWNLNAFQNAILNITPIPYVLIKLAPRLYFNYGDHRKKILSMFDYLANVPIILKTESPFLVLAHIPCPHPPFVFNQNGEEVNPNYPFSDADGIYIIRKGRLTAEDYIEMYRNQAIFITHKIKNTLDAILAKSATPPVIILQSDHGPRSTLDWESAKNVDFKEVMSTLNAYYFSDHNYKQLYEKISLVNTFRVIFNHYFGTHYEILPDKFYFSLRSHPFEFIDITEKVN
jgi:hypothetical protein